MSETLSHEGIAGAVALQAGSRIMRKVIASLRRMPRLAPADGSGLKTAWDDICVQIRLGETIYWDLYDEAVHDLVAAHVAGLPKHEREALWLQTDNGVEWDGMGLADHDPYPVNDGDITVHLACWYVYEEANRWSNARIRAFIDRSNTRD